MRKVNRLFLLLLLLSACKGIRLNVESEPAEASNTPFMTTTKRPLPTSTETGMPTPSVSITPTATSSRTETPSQTPTPAETATPSLSPTPEPPIANGAMDANCRYGPGTAYLYHITFYEGDIALVDGRDYHATWLWIKPEGAAFHCWVSAETVEVSVPVDMIPVVYPPLPTNEAVAGPTGVQASRSGSSVKISWNAAAPAVDLAYLVEARVCQNGHIVEVVQTTTATSMTLQDSNDCDGDSYANVRVQNKLGYSLAVKVSWH
ncbi:MAG: hypothetical protein JXA25_06065 [Anaerolineales bacterium]|nr:hypothetical protein [Anaerolineales bacterium]